MKPVQMMQGLSESDIAVRVMPSFGAMFDYWRELAQDTDPGKRKPAQDLLDRLSAYPELSAPFEDMALMEKYADQIRELFAPLFPAPLQNNEIKAMAMPFSGHLLNHTTRFRTILENAGGAFDMQFSDFDADRFYIMGCINVLNAVYGAGIEYKQPFYFDIPNLKTGITRRYRAFFNADFANIKPNKNTIPLTTEDIHDLQENFNNIALWKAKIPPLSYDLEGFSLVSLFDVTEEEALSSMKNSLLRKHALQSNELRDDISKHMQAYLNIRDVEVDFATFDESTQKIHLMGESDWSCVTLSAEGVLSSSDCFCNDSFHEIFENHEMFVVSDVSKVPQDQSPLIDRMREFGVRSFIVAPMTYDGHVLGFLEVSSEGAGAMNSVVASKLGNVLPMFTVAMQRSLDERETQLEAIVQEKFTALHSSVSWRFFEVAESTLESRNQGKSDPGDEVIFRDVVPMYGQFDIKGSSTARNDAIQKDLVKQLCLAEDVMDNARQYHRLPIYDHLRFRIQKYRKDLEAGIHAGDEVKILDFLKSEIYPVFHHLSELHPELEKVVAGYMESLDPELHVIYEERKRYEASVTKINEFISGLVESEQAKAQSMFPHYFEKYKTDGVEYNMYIGQSLQPMKKFNPLYLRNLRLWQLLLTAHVENKVRELQKDLPMQLEITSLILAHNNPLSIKFRQDEKKFDVDGAYNIRYEIMKKRIDKAFIKNTHERLTQPGMLSIVYSQEEEASEYAQYLDYLQVMGIVEEPIEYLELEDLQGTSGLKALRAELVFSDSSAEQLAGIYEATQAKV